MSATYAPGAPVRSSPLLDLQAEPPLTCLQQYALASKVARVYLALATLESAALLSITGLILGNHRKESDSVQYMAVLSIYMTLLFIYFTWDAIIRENVFQFATSALMHGVICAFVVWHAISQTLGSTFDRFALALTITTCGCQLIYLILWPLVHRAFGWRLYRRVGGRIQLQRMYRMAHIFFSILKTDLAIMGLLVLLASFFLFESILALESILNIVALVLGLIWGRIGIIAVRREASRLFMFWMVTALLAPAYIIYKFVQLNTSSYYTEYPRTTYLQFYIVGGAALFLRAVCVYAAFRVSRNFGLGLRSVFMAASEGLRADGAPLAAGAATGLGGAAAIEDDAATGSWVAGREARNAKLASKWAAAGLPVSGAGPVMGPAAASYASMNPGRPYTAPSPSVGSGVVAVDIDALSAEYHAPHLPRGSHPRGSGAAGAAAPVYIAPDLAALRASPGRRAGTGGGAYHYLADGGATGTGTEAPAVQRGAGQRRRSSVDRRGSAAGLDVVVSPEELAGIATGAGRKGKGKQGKKERQDVPAAGAVDAMWEINGSAASGGERRLSISGGLPVEKPRYRPGYEADVVGSAPNVAESYSRGRSKDKLAPPSSQPQLADTPSPAAMRARSRSRSMSRAE